MTRPVDRQTDAEGLAKAWRRSNRGIANISVRDDDLQTIEVVALGVEPTVGLDLTSLSGSRAYTTIEISQATPAHVRIENLHADAELDLTVDGMHGRLVVSVSASSAGRVRLRLDNHGGVHVTAENGCRSVVELEGSCQLSGTRWPSTVTAVCGDVHLDTQGTFEGSIEVTGPTTIHAKRATHFASLKCTDSATLTFSGARLVVDEISGESARQSSTINLLAPTENVTIPQVGEISNLTLISGSGRPEVAVTGRGSNVILRGQVVLDVRSIADNIEGQAVGKQRPTLKASPNAIVLNLRGEFDLDKVVGANLEGGPEGFLIALVRTGASSDDRPAAEKIGQAVLRGFRLPTGLSGRMLLSQMGSTFHVDPYTGDLPGTDLRLRAKGLAEWKTWALGAPFSRDPDERLHHDAEFMRELHRLSVEKGAPGAARTKIGWCAYRLRHATTRGLIERLALTGYRCLGYGERPIPALLTWITLSLIAAAGALGWQPDLTLSGATRMMNEALHQGLGPLAAVMRTGTANLSHDYEYILRALIAVPLITAALALRNYVKSGSSV